MINQRFYSGDLYINKYNTAYGTLSISLLGNESIRLLANIISLPKCFCNGVESRCAVRGETKTTWGVPSRPCPQLTSHKFLQMGYSFEHPMFYMECVNLTFFPDFHSGGHYCVLSKMSTG